MKKLAYILLMFNVLTIVSFAQTWTGNTSNDWNNSRNWNPRNVPTSSSDVTIPSGRSRYPIISSNVEVRNLTLHSSTTITLSNGATLGIYGNLSDAGYINTSAGNVAFRGTSNSTVTRVTSGYVNVFYEGFEGDVSHWNMESIAGNTEWRKQVTTGSGRTGTYDAAVYNLKNNKGHDFCHNCGYNYVDISTEIDLSSYSNANLDFRWMNAVNNSTAWAMVLIDGVTISGRTDLQGRNYWSNSPTYNLNQFCGGKHKLTFRFWIVPVSSTPGFSIDEINITAIPNIETFNNLLVEKTNNAQVIFNSPIYINKNIVVSPNAVLNTNSNNVTIYGNITNNGQIITGTSDILFLGNKKSKINGSANTTLYNLTVKKDDYTTFVIGDSLTSDKTIEITNIFNWDCVKDSLVIGNGKKTNFKINGNLIIGDFSTLVTKDTSVIILNGNYINYGIYEANNGKFIFEGTSINSTIQRKPAYIVYSDDFEANPLNNGWTLGSNSASAWVWSSGRQISGSYDMAIWDTRNGGAPYDYAWDVADGGSLVLSKEIDLTNLTGASMTFWWRAGGASNPSNAGDYGMVMIDNDIIMDKMWNQLDYTKSPKFELSKYCGKKVTLKFIFKSDNLYGVGQASSPGLCIDNLEIYSNSEAVETFYDLVIDKPNKNITVTCPIVIENTLDLKNGNLYTSPDTLLIGENATWTRENGMIYGNLSKELGLGNQTFTYPLGTACGYSPVEVTFYNITKKGAFNFNVLGLTPTYSEPTDENLKKYWMAINKGLMYDSVMMKFKYLSCDFNTHLIEKDDEHSMDWIYVQGSNHRLANVINRDTVGNGGYVTLTNSHVLPTHVFYVRKHYIDPLIVKHPEDYIICPHNTTTFSVETIGTTPFTYQWYKDGKIINGATNNAYTIANVSLSDTGKYHCLVKNRRNTSVESNKGDLESYTIHIVQDDTTIIKGDSIYLSINALYNKHSLFVSKEQSLNNHLIKIPINYSGNIFSVEWWINPYSLITPNVIGNNWGKFVAHNNALGAMYVGTNVATRFAHDVLPIGTIEVDKWQHFAFTFNNGVGKFYKNGILLLSKSGMTNPDGLIDTLYINGMSAYIDEIRFWKTERTEYEINYLMYKKPLINDPNLISFVDFDNKTLNNYKVHNNGITSYNLNYSVDVPSNLPCVWNTGETTQRIKVKPLNSISYTVTYTDCMDNSMDSKSINVLSNVVACEDKIILKGESVIISAIGANSYSWSNGQTSSTITVSPTSNTVYYVTGYQNNGLYSTDEVSVFIIPEIKDTSIFKGNSVLLKICDNTNSLDLKATNGFSRLFIPNNQAFKISGDMTIEMWVYNYGHEDLSTNQPRYIFFKNRNAEGEMQVDNQGKLIYRYGNGIALQQIVSNNSIPINKWTHIALVRKLSEGKIYWYINGVLDNVVDAKYTLSEVSSNNIFIGNVHNINGKSNQFNGLIDEFRMWNKSLDQKELNQVINNKLTDEQNNNTVLNIDFDASNGNIIDNRSPNKVNGTLMWEAKLSSTFPSLFNYNWSTGESSSRINVSPTITTTYTITVTKGNISKITNTIVNVIDRNLNIINENKILKKGETINLSAIGANSYTWSTGQTSASIDIKPTLNTTYYVSSYDGGLLQVDSVQVFVFENLNDTVIIAGDTIKLELSNNKSSLDLKATNGFSRLFIPNNQAFQISGDMTIEMWVYNYGHEDLSTNQPRYIFFKNRNAEGEMQVDNQGKLIYRYGNGIALQQIVSNNSIPINKWTHIALVRKLSEGKIYWYINGVLDNAVDAKYTLSEVSSNNIFIGNVHNINGKSNQFNGLIDEFRMWNKSLDQKELNQVINNKLTDEQNNNTVLNIDFDASNGNIIDNRSPNKVNGTLMWEAKLSSTFPSLFNYNWSTGESSSRINVSPTITTTYTITVTKGNISKITNTIVNVIDRNLNIINENKILKKGETINLSAIGANSYTWSTGQTSASIDIKPTLNTTYYVSSYDGGLLQVDSVQVFVFENLNDTAIIAGDTIKLELSNNKSSLDLKATNGFSRLFIPNNQAFQISGDMTIEMWVYNYGHEDLSTNQPRYIFFKNRNAEGEMQVDNQGKLIYRYGNGIALQQIVSNNSISINKWTHIALVRKLSEGKIYWYINGVLDNAVDAKYTLSEVSSNNIFIGNVHNINGKSNQFNGLIDEFRMWNKSLDQKELNQVINNKLTDEQNNNTVLNIDFDASNGNIINNHSPNKVNGTLMWEAKLSSTYPSLFNYNWSTGNTNPEIFVSPISTTTYTVTLSKNGITATEDIVVYVINQKRNIEDDNTIESKTEKSFDDNVNMITSDNEGQLNVTVFPNPSTGIINIELNKTNGTKTTVEIYNLLGKQIIRETLNFINNKIDLTNYEKGIYILNVTDCKEFKSFKVIIK